MNYLQRWFRRRVPGFERILFICTVVMLALLLVSQLLMLNANVRCFLSRVESLEGIPYRWPAD